MDDLFIKATRRAYRWSSPRGLLSVEQLWELPLTHRSGFDLDHVGRELLASIKNMGEESLISNEPDTAKVEAQERLEVLKAIIATRQEERRVAEARALRAEKRREIRVALSELEANELKQASRDELLERLAQLDD